MKVALRIGLLLLPALAALASHGAEWDWEDGKTTTWFATEAGLKRRFSVAHSPLGFLSGLTDFWGLRAGIRYRGYKRFSELGYVIELGGGTF